MSSTRLPFRRTLRLTALTLCYVLIVTTVFVSPSVGAHSSGK
jgi:hypothetical protein